METKKKKQKLARNVKVDDRLMAFGLECVIRKVEFIHFITDNGAVRCEFSIVGTTKRKERMVMFLPLDISVEVF